MELEWRSTGKESSFASKDWVMGSSIEANVDVWEGKMKLQSIRELQVADPIRLMSRSWFRPVIKLSNICNFVG